MKCDTRRTKSASWDRISNKPWTILVPSSRRGKKKTKKKHRIILHSPWKWRREREILFTFDRVAATGLDFNIQLDECLGIRLEDRIQSPFSGQESVDWKSHGSGGSWFRKFWKPSMVSDCEEKLVKEFSVKKKKNEEIRSRWRKSRSYYEVNRWKNSENFSEIKKRLDLFRTKPASLERRKFFNGALEKNFSGNKTES